MPLPVLVSSLTTQTLPSFVSLPTIFTCLAIYAAHIIARGPKTSRDRDLHDRLFIVTGIFDTALAFGVVEELAKRGARVIGLVDPKHLSDLSPDAQSGAEKSLVAMLLDGVRTRSKNEEIFLEPLDIYSPKSIREFCGNMIKSEKRVDGLMFCHEYRSIGSFFSQGDSKKDPGLAGEEDERQTGSMATFYITTLLLPSLLSAPTERDIRIVNVVNPLYAAALPHVSLLQDPQSSESYRKSSNLIKEGVRSLRMIVFMKHLQTVLNALPSAPVPDANELSTSSSGPSYPTNTDRTDAKKTSSSNISVCSVNPGISMSDTVQPLCEDTWIGLILYLTLFPLLFLFTKTSFFAMQSILHVMFVPTKAKLRPSEASFTGLKTDHGEEEIRCLVPGALYANCGVVRVNLPSPSSTQPDKETDDKGKGKDVLEKENPADVLGRVVWESLEREVKHWDEEEKKNHNSRHV